MRQDKTRLYGGVAAAVVLAALGGFGVAKLTGGTAPAAIEAPTEPAAATAGQVTMSADAVHTSGILVQAVAVGGLNAEVLTQATVVAAPNGEALLTARAAGAVIRINKRLGDPVRAGEALAVVESREASQIAAERTTATARANLAQKTLARERRLFEQRVSPRQDFEQAEAEAAAANAEARRAQAAAGAARVTSDGRGVVVTSPISGRITAASVSLGAFVQPETELFRVADPSKIQVEAAVSGADAARIAPGDRAVIETADGRTIEGRVRAITPGLNTETRTATAVIDVASAGLQSGQSLRARLFPRAAGGSSAIVVPDEAVQTVDGRDVVFVRTGKGFAPQGVTLGQRSAGRAEIVGGLKAGQAIAIRNAFLLKAELGKGAGEDE